METKVTTQTALLSKEEANKLANYLQSTGEFFIETIKGLSSIEWAKMPKNNGWTPAECADHLFVVEMDFKAQVDGFLNSDANFDKIQDVEGKENLIVAGMESREHKIKGAPSERKDAFDVDKDKIIAGFQEKRDEMINFIKDNQAPLKAHFTSFPGVGDLNAFQYCYFIGAHTIRHTLQIQEVIAE